MTTIRDDGRVEVAYDLTWTGGEPFKCFDWGYALRVAPDVDTLRWTRKAQWSVYPPDTIGRPQGIASAGGDPQYASARAAYADGLKPWPWSQDVLDGVTNEFRGNQVPPHHRRPVPAATVPASASSDAMRTPSPAASTCAPPPSAATSRATSSQRSSSPTTRAATGWR